MSLLSPADAAYAADRIYNLKDSSNLALFGTRLSDKFDISSSTRFEGVSGGLFVIKSHTGFGLIAKGKGIHQGEVLIATRGTASFSDGLTDADIGLQLSSTGKTVHAGFNKTFNSFLPELRQYFNQSNFNPTRVHCVGHSLGGALATMVADWLNHRNVAQTSLYTFGSPRVGNKAFAQRLTTDMGNKNIFRVCHKTDIVTMVPMWPFTHVPVPGTECFVNSPGLFPGGEYHRMGRYVESVTGKKWQDLKQVQPQLSFDDKVERWLSSSSPLQFTMHTSYLIQQALMFVLKKILYAIGVSFQAVVSAGMTMIDQMAMVLQKGYAASKEIAGHVSSLLDRILRFLGSAVKVAKDLTLGFIKWVLNLLAQSMYRLAKGTIQLVHAGI